MALLQYILGPEGTADRYSPSIHALTRVTLETFVPYTNSMDFIMFALDIPKLMEF